MSHSSYFIYIFDKKSYFHYCVLKRIRSRKMSQNIQILKFSDVWEEVLVGIKHIYQLKPMTTASWMKLFR